MLINRYKASPWYKSVLKDLLFIARYVHLYLRNGLVTRTVLFYPEFPIFKTSINRYLLASNFNISNNPKLHFDLVVAWEDTTHRPRYPLLDKLARDYRVVNLDCTDISKRKVEQLSVEVFGYGLELDPTRHNGPCVRKSDENGCHDKTTVLQCPIPRQAIDPDCVYQRLVDNSHDGQAVCDIRAQVFDQRICSAFLRFKPLQGRFTANLHQEMHAARDLLSSDEIAKILELARRIGLDYGEIDTVRDRNTQRLYVVDVNNTPQLASADVQIPRADLQRYLRRGRRALARAFLYPALRRSRARLGASPG